MAYSLYQVETGLRDHLASWVGRTLRLRAAASVITVPCIDGAHLCGTYDLVDLPAAPAQPLPGPVSLPSPIPGRSTVRHPPGGGTVYLGYDNGRTHVLLLQLESGGFLARLRGIPVVGRLLPGPQRLAGDTLRVTLRPAQTTFICPRQPCYEAVLPDADPADVAANAPGVGLLPPQQGGMSGSAPIPIQ